MDGRIAVTRVEDDCTNLVGECVAIQFRDFCLDEDNDPGARPPVVTNAVVTIRNFSGSVIPAAGGGFYNLTGGRIQTLDAGVIETANPDGSTDEELFGWKICEDPVSGCKWWSLETCALPANKHTGVEPDDPDYAALPTQGTYYRLSAQIAGRNVVINFEIDAGLDYSAEYRCECIPIEIVSIDEETLPVDQSDIWCLRVESCLTFLADGPGQVIKDPDNPGTWLIQFADHQSSDDSVAVSYDAAGNVWDHSISLTSDSPHLKIVQGANPGEWVFTDEDATLRDNGDGTFTWVNPDGTDGSTWSTSGSVRDNGDGTYTWVLPDGTDGDTWEGDGEVVDNGDGTFTWQGADGTAGSTWSTSGTVRDNGDGTFTWVLPDGTDGDTWEGRGDVVDNGDGTFSYLDANGAVVATWRADDDATVVTNPDGSLSYVDSDGNVLNTWHSGAGSVIDNGDGTFSWVTPGNVVVSTWTTDDDGNVVDNGDGTFSYLDADGNVVQTWFDGYRIEPDLAGGSWTVSRPDGSAYQITDDEFDESLVDNGDGTWTFTDDDGTTTTISDTSTGVVDNGDGTYTVTPADGSAPFTIDTSCKQFVDVPVSPCPVSFPLCGTTASGTTQLSDAAAVQSWLDAEYPGLTFDEAACRIYGCQNAAVVVDFELVESVGTVVLSADAGDLSIDRIDTSDGSPVNVTWPDGSTSSVASGGSGSAAGQLAGTVSIEVAGCTCVTQFEITGPWSFDVADLNGFGCLTRFVGGAGNVTSGDIADLPAGLTYYSNSGSNTTTGDIADLPTGLILYNNSGSNTTTGDIADLPAGLTYYSNGGQNTTTGDIADLPAGLTYYSNSGSNTTTGDIADLPTGLILYNNSGSNTTTGDIADLPAGLTYYNNGGQNTTTGDIADLPAGLTHYGNGGQNTTTGDIADLPTGLTYYTNTGSNTTTGDIADLPAGLTYYNNGGQNTTTGDIADLPTGLTHYKNGGQNTTYSGGYGFASLNRLFVSLGTGLTSAEVDQVLIDMAAAGLTPVSEKTITLTGSNGAPTAASAAAITTLQTAGWTVTTN